MAKRKPATPQLSDLDKQEIAALEIRIKQLRGEPTTAAQLKTLERFNKRQLEAIRDASLRALPKGVYCDLAGRQQR